MKKEFEDLPSLPFGEGSFSYHTKKGKTCIRLRKRINGKPVETYGQTTKECLRKMKAKEQEIHEREKCFHPSDVAGVALLREGIGLWLETYKKPVLKSRSYDTIESTFGTYISDSALGRIAIDNVSSEDVQSFINDLAEKKSLSTVKKVFSLLAQYFGHYYARDVNNNPMLLVKLPKKKVKYTNNDMVDAEELIVLTDEEIDLLTNELSKPPVSGKIGYKCGYMVLFIMWSYMRVAGLICCNNQEK